MKPTAIRLGRIGGVEVIADVWVLIIAGVLGWLQSVTLDQLDPGAFVGVLGVVAAIGYVASLVLHEASHSQVARRRGLQPRRIRLFVFGGFTEIADRDVQPTDEIRIALAGPAASLLAGVALLAISAIGGLGDGVADTLRLLGVVNIAIALFNLLPGLPLDGGRALQGVLWRSTGDRVRATQSATLAGRALGLLACVVGLILLVFIDDLGGFVLVVAGWFLYWTASAAGRREELIARAAGATARDVMRPTPDAVPGTMRVAEVATLFQAGPVLRTLPVEVGGRITGVIGQTELDGLSPGRRELGRASSVMTRIGPDDLVDADAPMDVVLARLSARDRLIVVEDGVAVGVIEQRQVLETLDS
jgi:Zn-dependent protease